MDSLSLDLQLDPDPLGMRFGPDELRVNQSNGVELQLVEAERQQLSRLELCML